MKKSLLFILISFIFLSCSIPVGFAFFYFDNTVEIKDIDISVDNASFNEVNNETYKVYFFASPYYATGAELDGTNTEDDPLVIAENENNPYIDDSEYGIMRTKELGESHDKYANVWFKDSNGNINDRFYIACENGNEDIYLQNGNRGLNLYKKKDFSGFIRQNNKYGITEKDYKYFSITVNKNISADILNNVIASTVFKDGYGFGPEFVGWTYNKATTKSRTMSGTDRYANGATIKTDSLGTWKLCDSRGYGVNGTPYLIGNYGVQGAIEQITSSTSLYHIDNLGDENDELSIDGSKKGDHIIYLYPVFAAKNYNSFSSPTPFLKFRINPAGKDEDNYNIYGYKQSGEIDYSKNRYTSSLFQTTTSMNVMANNNYYIDDIYIDTSGENEIKNMQLDVAPTANVASNGWVDSWTTIMSYDDLKNLNLDKGYYDVEGFFLQLPSGKKDEDEYTSEVNELYNSYKETNKYCAIYASKRNIDDSNKNGLFWVDKDELVATKSIACYFVIGFSKVKEYHLTSDRLNGSINDYSSNGFKQLFTTSLASSYKQYYQVEKVSLHKDEELAVLNGINSADNLTYSFNSMSNDDISTYNSALTNSTHTDKKGYNLITDSTDIIVKDNKIISKKDGNYSLLFNIDYLDGEAKTINVAFKENSSKFAFVVLKSKPTTSVFYDYNELFENNLVSYACEQDKGSILNLNTVLYANVDGKSETSGITIRQLFDGNSNRKLIDTVTGWEINKSMFTNSKFNLNRNYIVYFA